MTYNANIPQANDLISQSQGQILTNFSQADIIFDVDHIKFDDILVANRGEHKKVTFALPLVADPNQASPIASLYTKTVAGQSELFFQNGALPINVSQLTNSSFIPYAPVVVSPGYTFVPPLTISGSAVVIGGVTFYSITASWTSMTGIGVAPFEVSLPSTATVTGGMVTFNESSGVGIPQRIKTGTITAGQNKISIAGYSLVTVVNGQFLINGFYI